MPEDSRKQLLPILLITVSLGSLGDRTFGREIYTEPRPSDLPALINSLQDKDAGVRRHAAIAFGKIGRDAKAAVPALIRALKDRDEDVRRCASQALRRLGPAAVPALIEVMKDKYKYFREAVEKALKNIEGGNRSGR